VYKKGLFGLAKLFFTIVPDETIYVLLGLKYNWLQ